MSDHYDDTDEHTDDDSKPKESRNFRQLREAKEALEAENTKLRQAAVAGMVRNAGYDPDHPLTKLVTDQYLSGDDVDYEPTSFSKFAEGMSLPKTDAEPDDGGDDGAAEQMDQAQQPVDQAMNESSAPQPAPAANDEIARLEAEGRWSEAQRLKLEQVSKSMAG